MKKPAVVVALALVSLLGVTACSKPHSANGAAADGGKFRDAPDLGGVKSEYVEVEGVGATRAAAVDDALRLAIKQVNGVVVDASEAQANIATAITTSEGDVDIKAVSFAQAVATQSHGLISNFKIIKETNESAAFMGLRGAQKSHPSWRIRIGANIAKYQASAEANRPRLIVAQPRTAGANFDFGDTSKPSSEVQAAVRSRLNDALTQTNRFAVLDREFTGEIQQEMDLVSSGAVNKADTARLGQQLAADLIVIPTIERMEYNRHARQLRLADRELVSYSGGARITFRVINATTGQIVMSDSFSTDFPTTRPTTLGATVDAAGATDHAMAAMTQQFVSKLLLKTFPVSVISLNGQDVVLSQGGAAVRQGARYRAVILGDALSDPQTGQSLGRTEHDFGTIQITRSENNAAYGVIEGGRSLPAGQFKPGLIEIREEIATSPVVVAAAAAPPASATTGPVAATKPAKPAAKPRHKPSGQAEDQNW